MASYFKKARFVFLLIFSIFFHLFKAFSLDSSNSPQAPTSLADPLEDREGLISMTVITKEDIERCPSCDLIDILERTGVQVRHHPDDFSESSETDGAYISLKGASESQTIFLIDGVHQKNAIISEPLYPNNNVHHIKRIEILRGPSNLQGSPVKGVIHIFTKKLECQTEKPVCFETLSEFSNEAKASKFGYTSAHFRSKPDLLGFREEQEDYSRELTTPNHSPIEQTSALDFDQEEKNQKWLTEDQDSLHQNKDSDILGLGSTYYISPSLLFKIITENNRETHYSNFDNSEDKYISQKIVVKALGEYNFNFKEESYDLTVGRRWQIEEILSPSELEAETGEASYPQKEQKQKSTFFQLNKNQGRLTYQVTTRVEDVFGNIHKGVWTWGGNASLLLAKIYNNKVFLKIGKGTVFRAVGFDEKYLYSPSNRELEKRKTHEFGIRLEKDKLYVLDVVIFNTKFKNLISYDPVKQPTVDGKIFGAEFQTHFNVGKWSGKAQYSYIDIENTEFQRKQNPTRHLVIFGTDYLINPTQSLGLNLMYKGKREDKFGNRFGKSTNLIDIHYFYKLNKNSRVGIAVRNLTDKIYDLSFNTRGPGRTVWLTFEAVNF